MGLFGANYESAGVGVSKNEREKQPFFKFWEIYFRHFWKFVGINILFIIGCLPIFTIGLAATGTTKVLRNISQERPVFILHDMIESAKKNWKQALPVGIIDVVFIIGFIVSVPSYNNMAKENSMFYVPMFICLSCMMVFVLMHFYIYILISSTNLTIKQVFKNSFLLSCIALKTNLITLLISLVVFLSTVLFFPYSLVFVLLFTFSFLGFLICFNSYPVVRKYVINPYYEARDEENPEKKYMDSTEDAVFEDKGGSEAPIKAVKKTKGKRIS